MEHQTQFLISLGRIKVSNMLLFGFNMNKTNGQCAVCMQYMQYARQIYGNFSFFEILVFMVFAYRCGCWFSKQTNTILSDFRKSQICGIGFELCTTINVWAKDVLCEYVLFSHFYLEEPRNKNCGRNFDHGPEIPRSRVKWIIMEVF